MKTTIANNTDYDYVTERDYLKELHKESNPAEDFLPLLGPDHVEFYVGNARQAAYYYQQAFGYRLAAYSGPETGVRGKASYLLEQGKIRLLLTSSLEPNSEISEHVRIHGDGVKVLALCVNDATSAFNETVRRGAQPVHEPYRLEDRYGEVVLSSIRTYGSTIHTFAERKNSTGPFLPGFTPLTLAPLAPSTTGTAPAR